MINTYIMIQEISFEEIIPLWKNNLWPNRVSPIESHSAMMYNGSIEMKNFDLPIQFHAYMDNNDIVGTNSVHMCADGLARSRGLWVCPNFRQKGIGKHLLLHAIDVARVYNATGIWSYPRKTSWRTYESAGFSLTSDWQTSETSEANAYCYLGLK